MFYLFIIVIGSLAILVLVAYWHDLETKRTTTKLYLNSDDDGYLVDKHTTYTYNYHLNITRKRLCYYNNDICKKGKIVLIYRLEDVK